MLFLTAIRGMRRSRDETCYQSETLEYRVSRDPKDRSGYGPGVTIGSTKYQKTGPGTCN